MTVILLISGLFSLHFLRLCYNGSMQESNTKKTLWGVFGALSVLIVVLAIAIIVATNRPKSIPADDVDVTKGTETAYNVNDTVYDILDKLENDPAYTEGNAEQAFGELIENQTGDGKIYATVSYANFLYDETGDIERAATLMESIDEEVGYEQKAGFYISFSNLYKKAGMEEKADHYYTLATELYKGYNDL